MYILEDVMRFCTDPALANVLTIVKRAFNIIQILGPILAIIGGVIAAIKLMANPDEKKYKNLFRNMIIALLMLFFLPTIIDAVMKLFDDQFTITACWNYSENVSTNGQSSGYVQDDNDDGRTSVLVDPDEYEVTESSSSSSSSSSSTSSSSSSTSSSSTSATTYTNPLNNIKYNLYGQSDPRWGSIQYPSGNTIKKVGCMITSIAVVASAYDKSITPKTVFYSGHRTNYPRAAVNSLTANHFNCVSGSTNSESIKNYLRQGYPVVIFVYGEGKGGNSKYTSGQHYMALLGIEGDNIFMGTQTKGRTGWEPSSEILTSVQTVDYCMPTQALLNMYN